jgi:protease-4
VTGLRRGLAALLVIASACGAHERAAEHEHEGTADPAHAPGQQAAAAATGLDEDAAMAGIFGALTRANEPGYWDEARGASGAEEDAPHVAVLDLGGPIAELESFSWTGKSGTRLRTITSRLHELAADDDVKGIIIRFDGLGGSMATAEELRAAIADVAKQRPVSCHIDGADNLGYYVLTACSSIGLTPMGEIAIPGPLLQPMYLKGLLDRFGVKADFLHVGAFKGAAEPLTRSEPSAQMRQTYTDLLDGVYDALVEGIATGRKLSPEVVKGLIDTAMFSDKDALAAKLVDSIATWETYRDAVAAGLPWLHVPLEKDKASGMGGLLAMLGAQPRPRIKVPHLALIYAVGDVVDGDGEGGKLGASKEIAPGRLVPALRAAAADDSVKVIVLRVDSPGGSALAAETIWHAVDEARHKKPVVVSMGSLAASGGYYISAPGSVIFAQANTITGSIGVVGGKMVIGAALEKLGVTATELGRGKRAGLLTGWRPWNADERGTIEASMKSVYDIFVARVAEGRKQPVAEIEKIAQGRVWTGKAAKAHGLVDEIGGLDAALAEARSRGGLPADAPIDMYPPRSSLLDLLGSFGNGGFGVSATESAFLAEIGLALGPLWQSAFVTVLGQVRSFARSPIQVRAFLPVVIE